MRPLEDWKIESRIILALVIVVLAAAALFLFMSAVEGQQHPAIGKTRYDERLVQLDREAIETAYVEHIKKLFNIWVTDYSDAPPKAIKGAIQARSAYDRSMAEIDQREKELSGKP